MRGNEGSPRLLASLEPLRRTPETLRIARISARLYAFWSIRTSIKNTWVPYEEQADKSPGRTEPARFRRTKVPLSH